MESAVEAQQGVETAVNETESQQITQAQIATLAQVTGNNSQQQKVSIGGKKKKKKKAVWWMLQNIFEKTSKRLCCKASWGISCGFR